MNRHFSTLRSSIRTWQSTPLHPALRRIAKEGLIRRDGCLFLAIAAREQSNATVSSFEDKTGYECFINHIHVEDYVATNVAEQTFGFVFSILTWWNGRRFDGVLNSISTFDEGLAGIRFHLKRRNENWLADDLDAYREAVLELPSSEVEFLKSPIGIKGL